ncbi:methyltransferase domain-containing protein [Aeromicrobium sp. CF4.19]|uniref:class I SAM-dependent methyltransferase n=1 Tax=Aeromicrobium sp. CF4.19 TaxID=3373082 RepID=UPI003EE4D5DF
MTTIETASRGRLHVDDVAIRLPGRAPASVSSLDVILNGHRVWSIDLVSDLSKREQLEHPWPGPLVPFLDGTAHVQVVDSAAGTTLWTADVHLGDSQDPIEVVDALGRHVAMNKWGRLGKTFSGSEEGMRTRLLDRLDILIALLQELEFKPFVVGGTLLGAVRSGEILSHDDDADIAYLSEHSHPVDISLENSRLTDELTSRGYEIVKHSNTHLQITFRTDDGTVDTYIDIFTAFYTQDGQINQPFHVRGPLARSSMTPFSTVELAARLYPAPAVPEDWLVVNYDENWRTPLPGYKLRTPRATARRFQSCFGSYNFQRDFWEEHYTASEDVDDPADLRAADHLLASTSDGDIVIDLGCGAGSIAQHLAQHGRRVQAFDYSPAAIARARQSGSDGVDWHRANLIDLREVADVLEVIARADRPVHLLANHLLERLGHHGRANAWRVVRQVVRAGGRAVALVDAQHAPDVTFADPTTWHLELETIAAETEPFGLRAATVRALADNPRDVERATYMIDFADIASTRTETE